MQQALDQGAEDTDEDEEELDEQSELIKKLHQAGLGDALKKTRPVNRQVAPESPEEPVESKKDV